MVLVHDGGHGENRVRARAGLKREPVQSRDLPKEQIQLVHHLQRTLHGAFVLVRMDVLRLRGGRDLLVDLGIVLDRAGPLADIDVQVGSQILLRKTQEMLQHSHLPYLG